MVPLKVAVIGAGAAGLAALRHLAKKPELFHPIAFEQSFSVGGTWVYTEKTSKDEYGSPIHSSMYKNLRTNLPTQVMAFPDFPFRSDLPSFIMHTDMRNYLEDYTDHFNIRQYIQFGTSVERVHPTKKAEVTIWEITTRKVDQNKFEHWEFDMVMICNGHYSKPLLPNIPSMKEFQGTIIHSHNYRDPEAFRGKTVACLGAGSSGQDITLDVARCAKQVYICHRRPQLVSPFPPNVEQKVGGIKSLTEKGFIGEDQKFTEIDVLLLCTGYKYDFPFLTPECSVSTDDERVVPLYKHIIHIDWPTLSFIGIPKVICPFPLFDCQIQFVLAVENGRMKLPTQEEMYYDMQKDFERRLENGFPVRHAHHMGKLQWGYNDELAKLADFAPIPRVVGKLYDHVHLFRVTDLRGYKRKNFEIIDTENFRETGI